MARQTLAAATAWITEAAIAHPHDLADAVAERLAVPRRTASRLIGQLVAAGWLLREGSARRPRHAPGLLRQVVRRYPLAGLDETALWARDIAPALALPPRAAGAAQHLLGELVNNAVDHSGGTEVTVSVRQTPLHVQLLVSDDGCGLFRRIGESFAIDDPATAMFELGKGKLTSRPQDHAGRGLFFAARIADVLDLHANGRAFQHRGWQPHRWQPARPAASAGTSVFAALSLETPQDPDAALRAHSLDGTGYRFERTVLPLSLLTGERLALDSRAQARRVAARLDGFRRVELDFDGIDTIGHGFADELFRVWRRANPGVELVPLNAAPRIGALVEAIGADA